jgi:hypothetical protein
MIQLAKLCVDGWKCGEGKGDRIHSVSDLVKTECMVKTCGKEHQDIVVEDISDVERLTGCLQLLFAD